MMKLIVLGATGATGLEIVRQAIERGHDVTAFVRSPDRLNPFKDRIAVVKGDPLNSAELATALKGHDAVISGFGPRLPISKADTDLLQRFAAAVTTAMPLAGINRIVVESTAFLFRDSVIPPTYLFGRLFFSGVTADSAAMEAIFTASKLAWTLVRPPRLTDNSYTGKYRTQEGHLPPFGFSISRADVADCMIKAVQNDATVRKVLGAAN